MTLPVILYLLMILCVAKLIFFKKASFSVKYYNLYDYVLYSAAIWEIRASYSYRKVGTNAVQLGPQKQTPCGM